MAADVRLGIVPQATIVQAALLFPILLLGRRSGNSGLGAFGIRGIRPSTAVKLGLIGVVATAFGTSVWYAVAGPVDHPLVHEPGKDALNAIVLVLSAVIVAPAVEEIVYRGVSYSALRNRLQIGAAAFLNGLAFGLSHVVLNTYTTSAVPALTVFGACMCLLYERSGSILPGVGVHAFYNGLAVETVLTHSTRVTFMLSILVTGTVLIWDAKSTTERLSLRRNVWRVGSQSLVLGVIVILWAALTFDSIEACGANGTCPEQLPIEGLVVEVFLGAVGCLIGAFGAIAGLVHILRPRSRTYALYAVSLRASLILLAAWVVLISTY